MSVQEQQLAEQIASVIVVLLSDKGEEMNRRVYLEWKFQRNEAHLWEVSLSHEWS